MPIRTGDNPISAQADEAYWCLPAYGALKSEIAAEIVTWLEEINQEM